MTILSQDGFVYTAQNYYVALEGFIIITTHKFEQEWDKYITQ